MFKNNFEPHYIEEKRQSEKPLKSALSNKNRIYPKKSVGFNDETTVYSYPRTEYEEDDSDDYSSYESSDSDDSDVVSTPSGLQLHIPRPIIRSSTTAQASNNSTSSDKGVVQNWDNKYPPEDYTLSTPLSYPYTTPPTPYIFPRDSVSGHRNRQIGNPISTSSQRSVPEGRFRDNDTRGIPFEVSDNSDLDCPTNFTSNRNLSFNKNSAEKSKQEKKVKKLEKKSKNCCCGFIYRKKLKKERKKLLMM
ncbi:MAG: hypothetical protein KFW09_05810 [Oscillospiraceae bacterium]|nr:hypothetical protein [Oscillospiraceae bacterium]